MITKERMNEIFEYREGKLFYKLKTSHRMNIGDRAGTITNDFRCYIVIDSRQYQEHRLIFLMFHGYFPRIIDHISDDLTDEGIKSNLIENLRDVSSAINIQKKSKKKNASSIYKGVYFYKTKNKWQAYITKSKKRIHIGYFETEINAAKAYNVKALELYGELAGINLL